MYRKNLIRYLWSLTLLFHSGITISTAQTRQIDTIYPAESIQAIPVVYHTHKGTLNSVETLLSYLSKDLKEVFSQALKADVYLPPRGKAKLRPMIIFFHRGVDVFDSYRDPAAQKFCIEMARRGFVCVSASYRHSWLGIQDGLRHFYQAGQDVNLALAYFSEHANQFGASDQYIFLAGESFGATAALHGTCWNPGEVLGENAQRLDELYGSIKVIDGIEKPCRPRGIISLGGGVVDERIFQNDDFPMLFIHGEKSPLIRIDFGVPRTAFSQKTEQILDMVSKSGLVDQSYLQYMPQMLPLAGSRAIADHYAGQKDINLIPLEQEGSNLIVSKNGNLRTTARVIFDNSVDFIHQYCRNSTRIVIKNRAIAGHIAKYESALKGMDYRWDIGPEGEVVEKRDGYIVVRWKRAGDEPEIGLSTQNDLGLWSDPVHEQVKVLAPPAPKNTSALSKASIPSLLVLVLLIALVCFIFSKK